MLLVWSNLYSLLFPLQFMFKVTSNELVSDSRFVPLLSQVSLVKLSSCLLAIVPHSKQPPSPPLQLLANHQRKFLLSNPSSFKVTCQTPKPTLPCLISLSRQSSHSSQELERWLPQQCPSETALQSSSSSRCSHQQRQFLPRHGNTPNSSSMHQQSVVA